jgi:hypothetical protein
VWLTRLAADADVAGRYKDCDVMEYSAGGNGGDLSDY